MKRTRVRAILAGVLAMMFAASQASADDSAATAQTQIRAALESWTQDFNNRNSAAVCSLFAPDLLSTFRGQAEDSYGSLCANLQSALADATKTYHYDLDLKEILVSCDIAAVRLVWTLQVRAKDGTEQTTREPGLDIFRRQPDGSWKIARFLAYEAP